MQQFMYEASIPVLIRFLNNLSEILNKASTYAENKKIDPIVLASARLAPDMFPLSRQIQIATDTAKGCVARLSGIEVPSYADEETTLEELQTRINKTLTFIKSVNVEEINKSGERDITLKIGEKELHFTGQTYLINFVLPNFYFHVSMTYAILRHNGIEIGKMDYLKNA